MNQMTPYMRRKTCNGNLNAVIDRLVTNLAPVRADADLILTASPLPPMPDDGWIMTGTDKAPRVVKGGNVRRKRMILRKLAETRDLLDRLLSELAD